SLLFMNHRATTLTFASDCGGAARLSCPLLTHDAECTLGGQRTSRRKPASVHFSLSPQLRIVSFGRHTSESAGTEMAKNIVLLSDGTGQGASMPKAERTNVWKLWDATKKADPANQVTFYDEGLGAEHKREWWRWAYDLASRATGLGISQNIKDCYTALIEYYEPSDRVFLFGFSRGAFTVRSLGGVLSLCGIPQ